MHFAKSLLVGASCLFALAQAQSDNLAFTKVPASVTAGQPTTLEWSGGDNSAVTITLKRGPPENLSTVDIITGNTKGNSFTWTPPADLPSGEDYAFQINQGVSDVNYSGQFSLSGGSGVVSSVSVRASSRTAVSATSASAASKTSASAASVTSVASASVSSLVSSLLSAIASTKSSSLVATTVVPGNVTTAIVIGTGIIGTGTGVPVSRNTTMSRATLSSTLTGTRTVTTSVPASSTASPTGDGAESSPSPSANGNSAANLASPLAFVISAFVAIIYLG